MVDVHCHVLPGIDDGPSDLAASLALCRALVKDGITTVCATPHEMGRYEGHNLPAQIREMVAALRETLKSEGIPLEVEVGADVRVDGRMLELLERDQIMTIADKRKHILLELPHETFIDLTMINRALVQRGIQPILTHPERHHGMRARPELLARWVADGMLVQVTAGSIVGLFGPNSQENGWQLLESGLVHIIATDAHDHVKRPPVMTQAMNAIASEISLPVARRICVENPLSVLAGEHVQTPHEQLKAYGYGMGAGGGNEPRRGSAQPGMGGAGPGSRKGGTGWGRRSSWWSR